MPEKIAESHLHQPDGRGGVLNREGGLLERGLNRAFTVLNQSGYEPLNSENYVNI